MKTEVFESVMPKSYSDGGYRHTEVGLIPTDWQLSSIDFIGTISGRVGWKGYTKKDLKLSGPYAIGAKHIDNQNRLDLNDPTFLSFEKYLESPEIMVKKDDILIVQRGTIGKVVHIDKNIGEATINPSMLILRLKTLPSLYVYYFLTSKVGQDQLLGETSSTGVPMITQKQVLNFKVSFPSNCTEQTAIATALSDADALIRSLEQLIEKKKKIKQGAMQELLRPKEGWVKRKLGECATLKARIGWQGLTTAEYKKSGNYLLITGTEFKEGYIDWENCHFVERERYIQDVNIQVKENDILVTKDGTIGKVAIIKSLPIPATLNSGVFVIRPKADAFYPEFLYYLLHSGVFYTFLSQLTAGSTINHLYQKDFITFLFQVPGSIEEQKQISQFLYMLDLEIMELERKYEKQCLIKQGMMQNLLTGKIRLI